MKKIFKSIIMLLLTFCTVQAVLCLEAKADTYTDTTENTGIKYKAHVENIGWQNEVTNGTTAGSADKSLAMQAVQINYPNNAGLHLKYQVHVQDIGWMNAVDNNQIGGTVGKNLAMQAISIAIKDSTGKDSTNYSVYYRTKVRSIGWSSWTKNGDASGTIGRGLPMEAIQICVAKVGTSRYTQMESLVSNTDNLDIWYKAHVEDKGWLTDGRNGFTAGTVGKDLAMQAIQIDYPNKAGLHLEYKAHVENNGWMNAVKDRNTAGTVGKNLSMQAITIAIKDSAGKNTTNYSVFYRTHVRDIGWTKWTKDGDISGTVGKGLPMEAIQICVAKVGSDRYSQMQYKVDHPELVKKQAENLIDVASAEIGYKEGKSNDTKFGSWYGMNYNPWCAMFVSWCANKAGISTSIIPKHALCSDGATWFKNKGLWKGASYTPKPGDIIYIYRDGAINHVGIVEFSFGGIVNTIEGNTSDMVARRTYQVGESQIAGYGCPKYSN